MEHKLGEFDSIIEDKQRLGKLLENSFVIITNTDKPYEIWKEKKQLITKAINKDGNILDIGCANGFLLRSLIEWSKFKLTPYGIDVEMNLIEDAKKLLPEYSKNFMTCSLRNLENVCGKDLPKDFDFVYWNVWDNFTFENQADLDGLKKLFCVVKNGGRLILGFYDVDKNRRLDKINSIKKQGYEIKGKIDSRYTETIVWIDKDSKSNNRSII